MKRKQKRQIGISVILILCMVIAGLVLAKRNWGTDPGRTEPGYPGERESSLPEEPGGYSRTEVKKTLVMAVEAPLDAPYGKLAMAYKENVEEMSGGSLSIDIYENGLLGRSAELISSIGDGSNAVDIMLAPVRDLADAGCPDTGKLLEPYSFDGHAGFLKWASSREAETLLEEPEKTGLGARGLFFAEDGFSHLFLKENRMSVRGKRVAGEANDESAEYVDRIGGIYDYLPSVDIRDALLSGTLDGVERDCRFYQENALWEAAPYIVADSHLVSPCEALIKLGSVEKLSAEELDILKEAGKTAVEAFTEKLRQEEKDMLDEFTGHGAEVVKLKP
ncbi:TRAP transporter substrate-binding protein [Otoolea muris]|uniref:TRAP transporter substrate-binding protein n=1 Tax=Otoolea muris TaxID=2941515 RepID=UPI00203D0DD7|nr:TRAP transporter substrate-binding protein DctP [Otoolea muris]